MNTTEAYQADGVGRDREGSGPADPRVLRAVEEYLAALEAGVAPKRAEFLGRHADIAARLGEYLDGLELIHRAAPAAGASAAGDAGDDLAGAEPLGDFLLLREIGRGGMGVVYAAVQRSLNRTVALKVLPFAASLDGRHLQRFKNEAQAAACLHHPHIVPVFGVGCERGVHYYAMQLIDGRTLAALIAEQRRASGRPESPAAQPTAPHAPGAPAADTVRQAAASTERSPGDLAHFRRMAELGLQAAEALDHAHQLGVVHRDVKPANLMVDGRGGLWVTDFGLAQVQSDARLTMTGDLMGTLRYMSPEQALARRVVIDHRTDVYSLGATLYELLTLEPVFGSSDRQELLRQIAFEEPKPPRRINKAIPAELEVIALKAMEKNPDERYATAKEMADDLRRFLEDKPIRARRPSLRQVATKWARRHKAVAWSATACLLFALVTLGGSAGWVLSDRAARQREAESQILEAVETAEPRLREGDPKDPALLAAAKRVEAQLDAGALGPDVRRRGEQLVRDVRMLADLDEIRLQEADTSSDPDAERNSEGRFDVSGAEQRYAAAFGRFGIDLLALDPADAAARVRNSAIQEALLAGLDCWTQTMRDGDPNGPILRRVADAADDSAWRRSLREVAWAPDQQKFKALAAQPEALAQPPAVIAWLGRNLAYGGSTAEAVALMREGQLRHPADFWINCFLAGNSDPEEAVGYARAAVAIRPGSAEAHNRLGKAQMSKGNFDAARVAFQQAIALDARFALPRCGLALALRSQGDSDGAIASYKKAIELKADFSEAYFGLAQVLDATGNHDEARAQLEKALEPGKVKLGVAQWYVLQQRAAAHFRLGHYDKALADIARSIELQPSDASALVWIGEAEIAACPDKDFRKGMLALADQTVKVLSGKPDTWYGGEAEAYLVRARLLIAMNQPERASSDLERALLAIQKKGGAKADHGLLAELGLCLLRMQKFAEAEPVLRECLAIREENRPDDWRRFNTQSSLGGALLGQKKYAEAESLLLQGYAGMKKREAKIPPPGKVRLSEALERLVQFYDALGKKDKADEWRAKLQADRVRKDGEGIHSDKPEP